MRFSLYLVAAAAVLASAQELDLISVLGQLPNCSVSNHIFCSLELGRLLADLDPGTMRYVCGCGNELRHYRYKLHLC